ncbi:uncharacterized protein LOC131664637 [Phymastichus coffea]|uniref:uncharacterized protein LOC131664637 n=1 Tax=Phymastichus coffea TaxID=108790 RepID=UPI00273CB29C|nr:uncharacterized protein LOC131664637 [Phymastichus coffea]
MSTPFLAEDSHLSLIAPSLSRRINNLSKTANKFDHVMTFFVTVMSEFGYKAACLYNERAESWSDDFSLVWNSWKSPRNKFYEIKFILGHRKQAQCKLIGIPMGDWIILNLMARGASKKCNTRSMTVHVDKHINLCLKELGKFWHMKELGLNFKNKLLAPLHGEMMMEIGVAGPCLLGLPLEIKFLIADMLDKQSRSSLAQICPQIIKVDRSSTVGSTVEPTVTLLPTRRLLSRPKPRPRLMEALRRSRKRPASIFN